LLLRSSLLFQFLHSPTLEERTETDATQTTKRARITVIDMRFLFALLAAVTSLPALSWDGFDYDKGAYVEIQKGQLVRSGKDIEVFDYSKGKYIEVEVQSIQRRGNKVEVEVIDHDAGEVRTLEMDDK
jgi:hypothetical protein